MFYKETTVAGKTIEIYRGFVPEQDHIIRSGRNKTTPEEILKINRKNAETKLRRLLNKNFSDADFHITLTYRNDNRPDEKTAKKKIDKFLRDVKKEYDKAGTELKYILVTEYKNKNIHHHIIINGIPGANTVTLINKVWGNGFIHSSPLESNGQYKTLAEYLIKETDKTFRNSSVRKQRYTHSRNLIIPVTTKEKIKRSGSWHEVPKIPKGYYLDKDTLINGFNRYTGTPYQKYTIILITDFSNCAKTAIATTERATRKAQKQYKKTVKKIKK